MQGMTAIMKIDAGHSRKMPQEDPPVRRGRIAPGFIAAACLFLTVGAAKKPSSSEITWPSPPEQPRISYLQSIAEPVDLGIKRSGWGRFIKWIVGADQGINQKLIKPFGIGLDEADNLCVTDTGANVVCFFDAAEKRWHRWGRIEKVRFSTPVAIAKRGDRIFVADSALQAVVAFNTKGKLQFQITNGLARPVGLAISGDRLFVVDSHLNKVLVFDLDGGLKSEFGHRGGGDGEFNSPSHISSDRQGHLLVTDSLNGRVQLFNTKGEFQGKIGSSGNTPGHFGRPKGVAADAAGRVYVIDALHDNLQIFQRDGRLLLTLGEAGSKPGQFWLPNGIAITRDNRIFIADSYNRRIQLLKYVGP
jgi:sugar lactone lactonase YvrE